MKAYLAGRLARAAAIAAALALAVACDDSGKSDKSAQAKPAADGPVTAEMLPVPSDPQLARGRMVWAGTCQPCHGTGMNGAPKITVKKAWAPRIAKGLKTLVSHARSGFVGDKGTEMLARGGNPKLSDEDIAAAVAFMVSQSK